MVKQSSDEKMRVSFEETADPNDRCRSKDLPPDLQAE